MKKKLLLPLLTAFMLAGTASAVSANGLTNLSPNFEFSTATSPLKCIGQTTQSWNLPADWVKNQILNGNLDATGGAVVLNGGDPIASRPEYYKTINENIRLINFGGECGKVWAMNYTGSKLQETLKKSYKISVDLPTLDYLEGWYHQYQYIFIPDPAVMHSKAGKNLRCRIELNIYKNEASADNAFYGYYKNDQGDYDFADQTIASDNRVKFSDFYTNGKWDATKWMVYEFEFPVPSAPDEIAEWSTAPYIKLETEHIENSCLLIRNVTIYDPAEADDVPVVERAKKNFVSYTVGAVVPDPVNPDDPYDNADDISDNMFYSTGFHFNAAAEPLKIARQSKWEWNLPAEWVWQNFISGAYYEEGGSIALSGSYVIANDALAYDRMNDNIHLVDMEGTCGKVWALNFNQTKLSNVLANHDIDLPQNGFVPMEGWEEKYNLWFIPDWKEMAEEAVNYIKTFRVRMEVNLFDNDTDEAMTLKAWGVNDVNQYSEGDVEYAIQHPLKASEFVDENGKWDPTKWRAYEFDFDLQLAPGVVSEWRKCPILKVDLSGCSKGTLLIRNIFIWQPTDSRAASISTRKNVKWKRYTVKPASSGMQEITQGFDATISVNGNCISTAVNTEVFDIVGRKIAVCPAGGSAILHPGYYFIRTANGISKKIAVY